MVCSFFLLLVTYKKNKYLYGTEFIALIPYVDNDDDADDGLDKWETDKSVLHYFAGK